jgi:hypothetical protein
MPKYNLIDDLDSEEKKSQDNGAAADDKAAAKDQDETKLSDFIVDDIDVSEPAAPAPEEDVIIEKDDEPDDFTGQQKYTVPEGTPPMQPYELESEYEDEKQPGINFKPILIGVGIVAALVIIYFVVDSFILGGSDEPETEAVTETPEQKLQREREEQRQRQLLNYSTANKHYLSYIATLNSIRSNDVTFSSILFYDKSLALEVFASDRAKLAQFNMQLKNNNKIADYVLETAEDRPGSKGGVFALYNILMSSPPAAASGGSVQSTTASNWTSAVSTQFGLNLITQRQVASRSENGFSVTRNEFVFEGSYDNCNRLITQLASQNYNLSIFKLNLLPKDQRLMSKADYELRMIIDFYR